MITIELIDEFRNRTSSSYEDARFFLGKHNGDMLSAVLDFEKTKSDWKPGKPKKGKDEVVNSIADILQKGFDLRVSLEDELDKPLFSVPILLLLLLVPAWPLVLLTLAALMFLGFRIKFKDTKSTGVNTREILHSILAQVRLLNRDRFKNASWSGSGKNNYYRRSDGGNQVVVAPITDVKAAEPGEAGRTDTSPSNPNKSPLDDGFSEYTVK